MNQIDNEEEEEDYDDDLESDDEINLIQNYY